jgi:hypothetical protein
MVQLDQIAIWPPPPHGTHDTVTKWHGFFPVTGGGIVAKPMRVIISIKFDLLRMERSGKQ